MKDAELAFLLIFNVGLKIVSRFTMSQPWIRPAKLVPRHKQTHMCHILSVLTNKASVLSVYKTGC